MKIAIIGAGSVGGALGSSWSEKGHDITYAARDLNSEKIRSALARSPNARAAAASEAAAPSDVVVLATPWGQTENAIKSAGDLTGKVLIDATNPLNPDYSLAVGHTTSGGEEVARWARGARVVKAFNNTGFANMLDPRYGSQPMSMFICADDAQAKAEVKTLGEQLGFEVVDSGPLANARLLEPLASLWIWLAYQGGLGPNTGFKLLRR